LAGLHKVHPAPRIVNAVQASSHRVPTLCNHLLPHLLADILQTLHCCYGRIEDVHVTFWKCSLIFRKIYMKRYLLCVIKSSHTLRLTFIKLCTIVMNTLKMYMWFLEVLGLFWNRNMLPNFVFLSACFEETLCHQHLSHLSPDFFNLCHFYFLYIYLHQLSTVSIIDMFKSNLALTIF
jgi:hypothetical protein